MELFDLKGRTGIITGASSGIGLGTANVLAEAGAKIYALSRTGGLKDSSEYCHENIIHVKADVCDREQMEEKVKEIGEKDGIDFLINNAGVTVKCRAENFKMEDFDRIQAVNVRAVFQLSCLCYPYLKKSPHMGRIINISSMSAHLGFSEVVPYCTSKGAVLAMTRGLAVEWAGDNICVNSIAPGWFKSKMLDQVADPAREQKILGRMPFHAYGDTRDLGAMARFLCGPDASYITGQDFAVDGGALAFGY